MSLTLSNLASKTPANVLEPYCPSTYVYLLYDCDIITFRFFIYVSDTGNNDFDKPDENKEILTIYRYRF